MPATHIDVAVDADAVRAAVNKGYARAAALRTQLRELFTFCPRDRAVRVPGKMNVADGPSRGASPVPEQLAATRGILGQHCWTGEVNELGVRPHTTTSVTESVSPTGLCPPEERRGGG